jgi:hypothetical protein
MWIMYAGPQGRMAATPQYGRRPSTPSGIAPGVFQSFYGPFSESCSEPGDDLVSL